MKHASKESLDRLEPLLAKIRQQAELIEKKRGVFYLRSAALLHFHEDADGLFADLKVDGQWQRIAVNSTAERKELLKAVQSALE
jgi:hypothetical protein